MRAYANEIARGLRELGYDAEVKDIDKANGIVLTGVVVKTPESKIGVTIYVKEMWEKGMTVAEAVQAAKELYANHVENGKAYGDVAEMLADYEKVKNLITLRLYHESTHAEVKRSAKRYGFPDLILVPYINLEASNGEIGAVKVKEDFLEKWGIDKNTLFKDALANTKKDTKATRMLETLAQMQGITVEEAEEMFGIGNIPAELDQLVVSNSRNVCGASAIIGQLPILKKKFKNGFYVLPSSIHEVIVVPKTEDFDEERLSEMVSEVNRTTVIDQEALGHQAYSFV